MPIARVLPKLVFTEDTIKLLLYYYIIKSPLEVTDIKFRSIYEDYQSLPNLRYSIRVSILYKNS